MQTSEQQEGRQGIFSGLTRLVQTASELFSAHAEKTRRQAAQLVAALVFGLAMVALIVIGAVLTLNGLAIILDNALNTSGLGGVIVGGVVVIAAVVVLWTRRRATVAASSAQEPHPAESSVHTQR